jgi:hypothetical protein
MPIANIAHRDSIGSLTTKSTDKQIRANKQVQKDYGDLLEMYPYHPVEIADFQDTRRIVRWKANSVVRVMIDKYVNLNDLWVDFQVGKMPVEDMATVYRMMGYSLCGFVEIFGELLHLYEEEE